jgi:hypothetical protein
MRYGFEAEKQPTWTNAPLVQVCCAERAENGRRSGRQRKAKTRQFLPFSFAPLTLNVKDGREVISDPTSAKQPCGTSFTSLLASAARPPSPIERILMALPHDANDANLTRIVDDLIAIRELLDEVDHAQDALLQNGQSLQGQLEALTGQLAHLIQVLTPERPEQEGPSLADLLARILKQQSGMAALLRQILDALARLAPAEAATAQPNVPANGTGHA